MSHDNIDMNMKALERDRKALLEKGKLPVVETPKAEPVVSKVTPIKNPWKKIDALDLPGVETKTGKAPDITNLAGVLAKDYGLFGALVKGSYTGPTVTTYLVELEKGAKAAGITKREVDLARDLGIDAVRILGSVPGHPGCIGVEVPNVSRGLVSFKDTYMAYRGGATLPVILGASSMGRPVCIDLASMPHLLVAGTTGSGKSVFLHSVICSLMCCKAPAGLEIHLIDPKRVEFSGYKGCRHVSNINYSQEKSIKLLDLLVREMEERFKAFEMLGVKDIQEYLQHEDVAEVSNGLQIPYHVLIIDEFADLMMSGEQAKQIEAYVIRLAQKARAVGIHMVIATQRPSERVITKDIRDNIPGRIAFRVTDSAASRLILGDSGAECLTGKGDMLMQTETVGMRAQGVLLDKQTIQYISSLA